MITPSQIRVSASCHMATHVYSCKNHLSVKNYVAAVEKSIAATWFLFRFCLFRIILVFLAHYAVDKPVVVVEHFGRHGGVHQTSGSLD